MDCRYYSLNMWKLQCLTFNTRISTTPLSVSYVPKDWKCAIVTPVHKKGAIASLSNYRPISITWVASKLLERVIVTEFTNILQIITWATWLCVWSFHLLECLNDWTSKTQEGCHTIVIYIECTKAFDVVQQDKLFCKLRACGVDGLLLQ